MLKQLSEKGYEISEDIGRGYTRVYLSPLRLMLNNFLGGLAWGFGIVLGGTILVALALFLVNSLDNVPIVGKFISNLINSVKYYQTNP